MTTIVDIQKKSSGMMRPILHSIGLHALIIFILALTSYTFFKMRENLIIVNKKLIQASVRVDIVSMPTLTLKEMQALELKDEKAEPPAPAKEITTAEDKPLPENKDDFIDNQEKPQASFSDMLKKLGGRANDKKLPIKKNDNTSKGKGKLDSKSKQELSQLLVAGNKLSQGTALVGDSEAQDLTELEKYAASLPEKIKTFWRLPSYLMDQPLNCRVRVYIAPDGRLLNAVLFSSSGNAEFDQRAIQSIQQSAPFSPPENSYKDRAARGDIVLGFPL